MTADMRRFYDDPAEIKKWGDDLAGQGLYETEARLVQQAFQPGATVLDVGCGGGREALALAALGFQVTAVDYTPAFVEACRAAAAARGLPLTVREADARQLPFADNEFDHVIMVGQLLGHVRPQADRLRVLREIRRVMKPGAAIVSTNAVERRLRYGAYFLAVNLARRLYNPHKLEPYDAAVRRIGGRPAQGDARPIFHWYTAAQLTRDAVAAGWRVETLLRRWQVERYLVDSSTSGETFYLLRKDNL
jgi:SAM-dependent methyltransferase